MASSTAATLVRAAVKWATPSPKEIAIGLAIGVADSQAASLATSAYEHRAITHKGLKFKPVADVVAHFVLWVETTIDKLKWAGIHLIHHGKSDRPGDPHSPYIEGRFKVRWNSLGLYRTFGKEHADEIAKVTRKIPKGPKLFNNGWLPVVSLIARDLAMTRNPRIAAIALVRHPIYLRGQGAVNETGHRPDPIRRKLTKNVNKFWQVVTAGEALHGNHHDFPASPRFAFRPGEIDTSWMLIRGLRKFGVVMITDSGQRAIDQQDQVLAEEMRDRVLDEVEMINSSNGQGPRRVGRLNRYLSKQVVQRMRKSPVFREQVDSHFAEWRDAFEQLRPELQSLLDSNATYAITGIEDFGGWSSNGHSRAPARPAISRS